MGSREILSGSCMMRMKRLEIAVTNPATNSAAEKPCPLAEPFLQTGLLEVMFIGVFRLAEGG